VREDGGANRRAAWLAWSLCVVCVVLIGLALLFDFLTAEQILHPDEPDLRPGPAIAALTGMLSLAYPTIGALIVSRLPTNPVGWIFCGVGLFQAVQRCATAYADYALLENFSFPAGESVAWLSTCVWFLNLTLGVFLILLFPDGRLRSRRWRVVAWAAILGAALATFGFAFMPDYLSIGHPGVMNPFGVMGVIGGGLTTYVLFGASRALGMALLLASTLVALFSHILRLRRAGGNERQQIKWFLFAAVPLTAFLGLVELNVLISHLTQDFWYRTVSLWQSSQVGASVLFVSVLALLMVPAFIYVAILRFNLYNIDVVINRTLVYGALSACIVGIYVLAVVALGTMFQAQGNLAVSLSATALVAVVFQPLRGRLQRGVNRLMYGERDDPYAVISRLGKRLEAALDPEAVLPTVVETIAQALKLPYVAVLLEEDGQFRTAASYGSPADEPQVLPLVYQREEIGRLVLSPRARGEGFSDADRGLLEDLARQAEVAVHAVRLTDDLQRSRERLVATREEERRRLRRDLHDGLGAQLARLNVQAGTLRRHRGHPSLGLRPEAPGPRRPGPRRSAAPPRRALRLRRRPTTRVGGNARGPSRPPRRRRGRRLQDRAGGAHERGPPCGGR
jgi:signal transduction histidine kinase